MPPAERTGPNKVVVDVSLPEDFSINHALSLWLLDTLPQLDPEAPDYALNLVSLIEAVLENPDIILRKQVDLLKSELMARLKDEGVEYEERIARLDEVEWPMPGRDFIYTAFNAFLLRHPYLKQENVRPKSIAREMLENYQSFEDYIKTYKLERAEAVLLRHLNEVYKVLSQTIPEAAKTEDGGGCRGVSGKHRAPHRLQPVAGMAGHEKPLAHRSRTNLQINNRQSSIFNQKSPTRKNKAAFHPPPPQPRPHPRHRAFTL